MTHTRSASRTAPVSRHWRVALVLAAALATVVALLPTGVARADNPVDIWFPVEAPFHYSDTWGASRSGGRSHEGTDIMSEQMRRVFATNSGVIKKAKGEDCARGEYCSSFYLLINGDDDHSYFYLHLNNDTPGRPDGCDGTGGAENAFSPRLVDILRERGTLKGVRVERGEHIAYVGSSGNAGCKVDHLHIEIWHGHDWGSPKINPYRSLRRAEDAGRVTGEDEPDRSSESGDDTSSSDEQTTENDGSTQDGSTDHEEEESTSDGDEAERDPQTADEPQSRTDGGEGAEREEHGRIAGGNRILTAVELSRHGFASAETVVLAPANYHPEALVAAPLASLNDAPVLLAWNHDDDALPAEVAAEIDRLGATDAVIVGSPDRLSPSLEDELVAEAGLAAADVRRIDGVDRYAIAANVARDVLAATDGVDSPVLALGEHEVASRSWADALGASVVAATQHVPVLLVRPYKVPGAVKQVLAGDGVADDVRIAGGEGAISRGVAHQVEELGLTPRRLAGETRYGTSVALADELISSQDSDGARTYVATGRNFPDAIAAGPAVAARGGVLVMVDGRDPEQAVEVWDWLGANAGAVSRVDAVGGTGVVTQQTLHKAADVAG